MNELSKKILDGPEAVVTVRVLLCVSPDLMEQWSRINRVPLLGNDKPDPKIPGAKWTHCLKRLYPCLSMKSQGLIGDTEIKLEMLIDSRAQLCLMSKDTFEELDIPVDLEVDWTVGAANSQRTKVY